MEDSEPLDLDNSVLSPLEERIELPEREIQELFYANSDNIIHNIEQKTGLYIAGRESYLTLRGNENNIQIGKRVIENIISLFQERRRINQKDVSFIISRVKNNIDFNIAELQNKQISIGSNGKVISPKSLGQARYFEAIKQNDLVFAIGPAGTGKTYLAMAFALHYLIAENISRIILTRPAVEAGESLGYLPGDLEQKVNPYLRPLYDAIYDMIPYTMFQKYVEKGAIEVAPLAYMRGRTLHDSFIILDEAQNTSRGQILMFLTRLGFNSKTIVTGDITQIDLPKTKKSGLIVASKTLERINGISFVYLGPEDVVRHPLVEEIIKAFESEGIK
ncbi:MAG: PhoH family protein [Spirochaetes bacterium]|nr:PhoH family protein [Spirochaetota bacterium]MCK5568569.1 PhoH family protein [Spirochaetota bacterium]